MADFSLAVERTLGHEGGFVDDPDDPGGATNWGISTTFLRSIGDQRDVRSLSREDAVDLYREHWWVKYHYGNIESQAVAERLFDLAVNSTPGQAARVLQRALRANGMSHVIDDGVIGQITLAAVNQCDEKCLLAAWRSEMAAFYRILIERKPYRAKWRRGWLRRAYEDEQ